MIMRMRAITLPRRAAVGVGLVLQVAVDRGGDVHRARLDAERVDHELRRARGSRCSTCDTASARRSRSSARARARRGYAVTAESTPPETPTTARSNPRRAISSRRKWTSQSSTSAASMSSGGGPLGRRRRRPRARAVPRRSAPRRASTPRRGASAPSGSGQRVHAVERERCAARRPPRRERLAQVRHHRLEVGDERHVGARARDVGEVDRWRRRAPLPRAGRARARRPSGRRPAHRPGNCLPPSLPTRFASATIHAVLVGDVAHEPLPPATRWPARAPSSVLGHAPRAGGAEQTKMICAPSSAAIVPVSECHASSQTSIAARPHGVSNARMSRPRSTNRSSSNSPYVGGTPCDGRARTSGVASPSVT